MYNVLIKSKLDNTIAKINCDNMEQLAHAVAIAEEALPCEVIGCEINGETIYCSSLVFSLAYILSM